MSDVPPGSAAAVSGGRVTVNGELFKSACAAKGARTEEERAKLIGTTPKMTWNYRTGNVEPGLTRARRIAAALGVEVDELWPAA